MGRVRFVAAAAVAALGGGFPLSPTSATPVDVATTFVLKAADPSALVAHRTVEAALVARGLRVTDETAWTVTAHGRATTVAQLPPKARGLLAAALPVGAGLRLRPAAAQPLDGHDFRNAYTAAGVAPPSDVNGIGGATIATIQLSSFDQTDLTNYAAEHGRPDPVAQHRFVPIQVDGGPTDSSGDVEVDLDQESILSTSPAAKQQAYFAPNSVGAFLDAFAHVYDDVTQDKLATAPDPHIVAVSASWGSCESAIGASTIKTFDAVLRSLVGAGVTIFTSSGDFGIYGCGDPTGTGQANSQPDVTYPASSPYVVGVGGTSLQPTGSASAPNNGSNWAETSWSCSDNFSCQTELPPPFPGAPGRTGGTGGGASGSAYDASSDSFAGFPAPAYQTATVQDAPFAHATRRLVPDIAADGDPATGFVIYTSNSRYVVASGGSHHAQFGGTSLASPVTAALLDNVLVASGRSTGVGDIHNALYSAYADTQSGVVRDIRSGENGADADRGSDPSVVAQPGYDTNTGIGAVLWPALLPYVFTTSRPTVSAALTLPRLHDATQPTQVQSSWSGRPQSPGLAVKSASITISRVGVSRPVLRTQSAPGTGAYTFTGAPGATYVMTVRATDLGGRVSSVVTRRISLPIDDRRFALHGRWHRIAWRADIAASHVSTSARGAYASVTATGHMYTLQVVRCPRCGFLAVYLGRHRIKTLNLFAPSARHVRLVIYGGEATRLARRSFTFRCLHRHSSASSGWAVHLDALYVT